MSIKSSVEISVLLPTRGRTDALEYSIASLVNKSSRPESVEYLLAFDDDDRNSSDWFLKHVAPKIEKAGSQYTSFEFPRLGYVRLNEYVNALAKAAVGRWLMFWNDDAVMNSPGWDRTIAAETGFKVLRMPTHNEHPYAIFPIVPNTWYELFGYLSAHQISDAWISQIAYMLDIIKNIDVDVTHDRHDLTGNNQDTTYQERIMLEGRPNDPKDFNHLSWRNRRFEDAYKIFEYLKSQETDVSWFEAVLNRTQDPWEKMCGPEYDPNKQLSKLK